MAMKDRKKAIRETVRSKPQPSGPKTRFSRREFNNKILKSLAYILLVILGVDMAGRASGGTFKALCPRDYFCLKRCPFDAIKLDAAGFPVLSRKKCVAWVGETGKFKWRKCGLCLKGCPTRALLVLNRLDEQKKHTT